MSKNENNRSRAIELLTSGSAKHRSLKHPKCVPQIEKGKKIIALFKIDVDLSMKSKLEIVSIDSDRRKLRGHHATHLAFDVGSKQLMSFPCRTRGFHNECCVYSYFRCFLFHLECSKSLL